MAALNFPASPTVGDLYSANGVSYEWDGTTWNSIPAGTAEWWSVTATGTGASQDITLPDEYTPTQVLVFVNGVRYESDEYTISGTTLTMQSNAAGDSIEVTGLSDLVNGGSGGGGSDWVDLTFSGVSSSIWGPVDTWACDEDIVLADGDMIEVEAVIIRATSSEVALLISQDGSNALRVVRQTDNNYVLYRYTTTGGGSTVVVGGSISLAGAYTQRFLFRITLGATNHVVLSEDHGANIKQSLLTPAQLPLVGNAKVYIQPNGDIGNLVACRYRKVPA